MQRLVVVGASLAGLRAAQAARADGFDGELIVVGDEPHLPYTRPPLSKELMKGLQTAEQCALPHGKLSDVTWRLGSPATGLDRTAKTVQLKDGGQIPYDRLIIATGSRARPWPREADHVHTLRGLDDALELKDALTRTDRLLIVGAGFIGCEVAASARALGLEVTLVDIAPHPMVPLGSELGERCAQLHRDHGVDLRCSTGVEAITEHAVALTDGTTVTTDTTLVALGALPNTEWLARSGLTLDPGLQCDATLTSPDDPDVLAAGDIVSWPHPLAGNRRVRVEHWTTAAEHGQLAGRNALKPHEERDTHEVPPYFWSDQYEVKIQAVGFSHLADRVEIVETTESGDRLVAVGTENGRVISVVGFNAARRLAWYRRQLVAEPSLGDIKAQVRSDESALGAPVGAPP